jgi:hypothetical protein
MLLWGTYFKHNTRKNNRLKNQSLIRFPSENDSSRLLVLLVGSILLFGGSIAIISVITEVVLATGKGDQDGDGVSNEDDNCDLFINPDQIDTDGDGQGDACDADADNDGKGFYRDNCPSAPNPDQLDSERWIRRCM